MTLQEQQKRIEQLEEQLAILKGLKIEQKEQCSFSRVTISKLREFFEIERSLDRDIFDSWFNSAISIDSDTEKFLVELLEQEAKVLSLYNEEDLKMYFLSQLFNHIQFKNIDLKVRFFSEESFSYETDRVILNGTPDFIIAKGLDRAQKPYFFLQEFKQERGTSDPEYQLLAELISAVELNSWSVIKGCYIKGIHWYFVVLERLEKHSYQYYVSQSFDSTKIEDLKAIYRNLLFVKNEVIEMIKRGD